MYPEIYRWLEECYRFIPVQRKGDIACEKNNGLGYGQKKTENQQRFYRLNKNAYKGGIVKKINIERTHNASDYTDYITVQSRDTSLDNSRDRSTTAQLIQLRLVQLILVQLIPLIQLVQFIQLNELIQLIWLMPFILVLAKRYKLNKDDLLNIIETLKREAKNLGKSLGIDNSDETTRGRQSTRPAVTVALSHLNKPTASGKTGSQLEQSNASRRINSHRNLNETDNRFNGDEVDNNPSEQVPIYPDDSYDLYSEKASKDNLLDSEPMVTDATPGVDESPAVSIVEDDATSDGEESTDSDYDFEMIKLFAWLDEKDWARSYYDSEDGVVIHVEPGKAAAAKQLVAEEFPNLKNYSVVDTDPGVCRYCADPGEEDKEKVEGTNQNQTPNAQNPVQAINTQATEANSLEEHLDTQTTGACGVETEEIDIQAAVAHNLEEKIDSQAAGTHGLDEEIDSHIAEAHGEQHVEFSQRTSASQSVLLQPGFTITSDEHQGLFSGRVGSKGLTVAHIGPSNNIHRYSNDKQHLIGTMEKFPEVDVSYTHQGQTTILRTTADLGLFDLEPYCLVRNIICDKQKGNLRLKLYRGNIRKQTPLRIIDQNGNEKHGKLISGHFTLKRNRQDSSLVLEDDSNREVYNMLQIQNEKSAISDRGDSGTLVTSIPKDGSNELFVYGVVTHLHKEDKCEQGSSTIANRLLDVLNAIDGSGRNVGLRDPKSNDIDFTEHET